jgi:hypothetical protein
MNFYFMDTNFIFKYIDFDVIDARVHVNGPLHAYYETNVLSCNISLDVLEVIFNRLKGMKEMAKTLVDKLLISQHIVVYPDGPVDEMGLAIDQWIEYPTTAIVFITCHGDRRTLIWENLETGIVFSTHRDGLQ